MRCTKEVLIQLGIRSIICPKTREQMLDELSEWGYTCIPHPEFEGERVGNVLEYLSKFHSEKKFYISTPQHAMAFIQGKIVDTSKGDSRKVLAVHELQ